MKTLEPICSRDNPRVKEYCKLGSGKQARRKLEKFVLEGTRLCEEALLSGITVEYAFVTEAWCNTHIKTLSMLENANISVFQISEPVEKRISETSGPQGIYFVCPLICQIEFEKLTKMEKILCLYDIQDPGNLGTMIRSADAFGFDAVVLSQTSCDLFSPKTLRSTMGSIFHLPYYIAADMSVFAKVMAEHDKISAAAVVTNANLQVGCCNLPEIHLLYIGNEGNGLPRDFADACRYRITLPMKGKAESLNAAMAASILMWELTK